MAAEIPSNRLASDLETARSAARRSLMILAPYARRHRARLLAGVGAALAVVGCRLLLPLPLRSWVSLYRAEHVEPADTKLLAAAFLGIVLGLGLANLLARLAFARFAIAMVADLRAAAFAAVPQADAVPAFGSGEAVARLVGDTARIKSAVKGFLVHVATHALFVVGMSFVLFWIWPSLGWVLLTGAAALAALTTAGAASIFRRASRYRGREGRLAESIQKAWDDEPRQVGFLEHNRKSGDHEAALTRIQELVTWGAHALFGVAVLGLVAFAGFGVADGRLSPGDLVLVAFYSMMLRTPIVQLARQGARTGKIFACVERVGDLLEAPRPEALPGSFAGIELRAAVVRGHRRRFGPVDLTLVPGQHVLVVGRPGAGKTTLLELLAGLESPSSGEALWNGEPHPGPAVLSPRKGLVGLLAEDPVWPRAPIRELLGLDEDMALETLPPRTAAVLQASGAGKLLQRLSKGLDTKLAAADLSSRERRALALARAVLGDAALVLLDEPARDLGSRRAERVLRTVHEATRGRTLVAAVHRPRALDLFDRLVELHRGRVVYDGDPPSWRAKKAAERPFAVAEAS